MEAGNLARQFSNAPLRCVDYGKALVDRAQCLRGPFALIEQRIAKVPRKRIQPLTRPAMGLLEPADEARLARLQSLAHLG